MTVGVGDRRHCIEFRICEQALNLAPDRHTVPASTASQDPVGPPQDSLAGCSGEYRRNPGRRVSHTAQENDNIKLATDCNPQSFALPEGVCGQPPVAYDSPVQGSLGLSDRAFSGEMVAMDGSLLFRSENMT